MLKLAVASLAFIVPAAFGCGGGTLSDEAIKASSEVAGIRGDLEKIAGTALELTAIVRGENQVFDIDQAGTGTRARCAANFTFVYFKPVGAGARDRNLCYFGFDIVAGNTIDTGQLGGGCRTSDGTMKTLMY